MICNKSFIISKTLSENNLIPKDSLIEFNSIISYNTNPIILSALSWPNADTESDSLVIFELIYTDSNNNEFLNFIGTVRTSDKTSIMNTGQIVIPKRKEKSDFSLKITCFGSNPASSSYNYYISLCNM
jgi:hypothetical protein